MTAIKALTAFVMAERAKLFKFIPMIPNYQATSESVFSEALANLQPVSMDLLE